MLVLAPHPDDAEIAAFGLYAYREATVVTITTGNAGPRNYEAVFDDVPAMYHFKGRIRLIDSITVPWQGGIPPDRTFNMGYFDARLAEMHDKPTAVIPEMYSPNTDIGAYLKYNLGSLLPKRPRASTWTNLVDDLDNGAEEGQARGHRGAAPAARFTRGPSVHDGRARRGAVAPAATRDAVALHQSRRSQPLSVWSGRHRHVVAAARRAGSDWSIGCTRTRSRRICNARSCSRSNRCTTCARRRRVSINVEIGDDRASGTGESWVHQRSAASTTCAARRARTSCSSSTTRRPSSPSSTRSSRPGETRATR